MRVLNKRILAFVLLLGLVLLTAGCGLLERVFYGEAEDIEPIPSVPTAPAVSIVSSSQLDISWSSASGATSYSLHYQVGDGAFSEVYAGTATSFSHTGLSSNTTYIYKLKAVNEQGSSEFSEESGSTTDLETPVRPTASVLSASQLNILWNSVDGATGYVLMAKAEAGTYEAVFTGVDTTFKHTGLTGNTTYYYKVKATKAGGESAFSHIVSQKTDLPSPTTPEITIISSSQLDIKWSSVDAATSYVLQSKTDGGTFADVYSGSDTAYSHIGLQSNTIYHYQVKALNATETSVYSADAMSNTDLATPTGQTLVVVSSSQIDVSWSSVSGATGYVLEYKTSTGSYAGVSGYDGTSTSFSHTGLAANATYFYRVKATKTGGESAYSTESSATTKLDVMVAPSLAVVSSSRIDISWSATTGATGYKLRFKKGSGGSYSYISVGLNTSYSHTDLSANSTYYYSVSAINDETAGDYSAQTNATTKLTTPAKPTLSVASSTQINVSLTAVTGATSYELLFKISGGTYATVPSYNGTSTTYNHTGLSPNSTYYYKVKAKNATTESAFSAEANATTKLTTPAVPTLSVASSTQINVSLTAVTGATSYELLFKISGGTYATVPSYNGTSTTYNHTGLSPNSTYYYKVKAKSGTNESAFSAEATATTLQGVSIAKNGSGDLVATVSGSDFTSADYVVYDWRKNDTSIALVNMPFEETGNIAKDYTSYGHHGTTSGTPVLQSGIVGKAVYLESADYISLPNIVSKFSGKGSVISYVKRDYTGNQLFWDLGTHTDKAAYTWINELLDDALSSTRYTITNVSGFAADDWNSYFVRNNGLSNGHKFQIQGVDIASKTGAFAFNTSANIGLSFKGWFSFLLIFNRYLSDEQLVLYNSKTFNQIASQELNSGESWTVVATPITSGTAGTSSTSNSITIP